MELAPLLPVLRHGRERLLGRAVRRGPDRDGDGDVLGRHERVRVVEDQEQRRMVFCGPRAAELGTLCVFCVIPLVRCAALSRLAYVSSCALGDILRSPRHAIAATSARGILSGHRIRAAANVADGSSPTSTAPPLAMRRSLTENRTSCARTQNSQRRTSFPCTT